MGRKIELTPELVASAAECVRTCLYFRQVADLLGVTRQGLHKWRKRGRAALDAAERDGVEVPEADRMYADLALAFERSSAEAEKTLVGRIEAAGAHQWQAAAWLLERRHPERWGRDRAELRALKAELTQLRDALLAGKKGKGEA